VVGDATAQGGSHVRVTYNSQGKAVYIYLRKLEAGDSVHQCAVDCDKIKGQVVLDVDKRGRLIGIEILGGHAAVPLELLDDAERI